MYEGVEAESIAPTVGEVGDVHTRVPSQHKTQDIQNDITILCVMFGENTGAVRFKVTL